MNTIETEEIQTEQRSKYSIANLHIIGIFETEEHTFLSIHYTEKLIILLDYSVLYFIFGNY